MKRAFYSCTLLLFLAFASCVVEEGAAPTRSGEAVSADRSPAAAEVYRANGPTEPAAVCGDGTCTPHVEGCGNCPSDCPCWQQGTICSGGQCVPICGDGVCLPNVEGCGNCPVDCPCPSGLVCQGGHCVEDCAGDPCCIDPVCCGDICCRKPWLCEPQAQ